MLDEKRVRLAAVSNVAFVCRMCTLWYLGEDLGLKDAEGGHVCASNGKCGSPISGKSFEEYDGPLKGNLVSYCYLCGQTKPGKALAPNKPDAPRIGCCNNCFENEVKHLMIRQAGKGISLKKIDGNKKYEVLK